MFDQAQRLRSMVANLNQINQPPAKQTRVITVTSGKGGVGKSNFTLNYALALAGEGNKVVILDADVGFANIDVLLGVKPTRTLADLIGRRATIWEILTKGPQNVEFIAGGSGFQELLDVRAEHFDYVIEQLGALQGYADYVLIDTGAGLNEQTLRLILAADEVFVILTPEPTSITDAYALIKVVVNRDENAKLRLVVNRAQSVEEGRQAAEKVRLVAERFLNLSLTTLCIVPDDPNVTKSVKQQVPFLLAHPDSQASRTLKKMIQAQNQDKESFDEGRPRGMKQFLNRMVRLFR
jgi:flagellar biosynthesis protein FlhG